VWSPALLGWVAQAFSLRAAMGAIAIAALGIVAGDCSRPATTLRSSNRRLVVRCTRDSAR
jgi:hypothetical protein